MAERLSIKCGCGSTEMDLVTDESGTYLQCPECNEVEDYDTSDIERSTGA